MVNAIFFLSGESVALPTLPSFHIVSGVSTESVIADVLNGFFTSLHVCWLQLATIKTTESDKANLVVVFFMLSDLYIAILKEKNATLVLS